MLPDEFGCLIREVEVGQVSFDERGRDVAGAKLGTREAERKEWRIDLHWPALDCVDSSFELFDCRLTYWRDANQLGEHRVIPRRDCIARFEPSFDTDFIEA